jgi:hypothetical protein
MDVSTTNQIIPCVETITEDILFTADGYSTRFRFTPAELRSEIHSCQIQAAVAFQLGEDDLARYYLWMENELRFNLDLQMYVLSNTKEQSAGKRVDIKTVKSRNNIVTVASRYTKLRKSANRFVGTCPLHDQRTGSFTVYPDQQTWFCFSCSRGGDVIDLVMAVEKVSFKAALENLDA